MINLGFKLVCREVCGGLWCGLWWFVVVCGVVCGSLWWFVVVCGGLWCLVPPISRAPPAPKRIWVPIDFLGKFV